METILRRLAKEIEHIKTISYNDAESRFFAGTISMRQWRIFCLFWDWCSPHFGYDGWNQDRCRKRCGIDFVINRMNQFRVACGFDRL